MALFTIICRRNDGFPLVASSDIAPTPGFETLKQQARAIAKKLDTSSPSRSIVDSGSQHLVNYAIYDGVLSILVVTEKSYPRRLTFGYIQDLYAAFVDELRHHGPDHRQVVAISSRPYQFQGFDRTMQRLARDYQDTQSKANQARLADELADVHNIMRKNISELLDRGEKLGELSQVSARLKDESKRLKFSAKKLNLMDAWSKIAPVAALALVLLGIVYWRFFS